MTPRLFIVGYRGTGKTSVGRALAARLGWGFVDADELLEARAGKSVRAVFAEEGEPAFRDRESAILVELATSGDWGRHVISTGGGVVLRPGNRALLVTDFVVLLTADAKTIHARLGADPATAGRRPDLTAAGGLAEVEALLAARGPLYREVAALAIDTVGKSPDALADAILSAYRTRNPETPPAPSNLWNGGSTSPS